MKLTLAEKSHFDACVQDMLLSTRIQQMEGYIQHGKTSCLQHCIAVAYYSYVVSKRLHLVFDDTSLIRGALLHDFFLYDWHDRNNARRWHGFTHPGAALKNAESYFKLNDLERDIITKHMWPLTIKVPKHKESLIVCLVDKCCSAFETLGPYCGNRTYNRHLLYCGGKIGHPK